MQEDNWSIIHEENLEDNSKYDVTADNMISNQKAFQPENDRVCDPESS